MALRKMLRLDASKAPIEVVDVRVCDSKMQDHLDVPRFATWRAFPVQGPIDYCDQCCVGMQRVYEALGAQLHVEAIPLPRFLTDAPLRAMNLTKQETS